MRSVLILAIFGLLLLAPGVSPAETSAECQTKCSMDMSSAAANCPPPGDEGRMRCFQENQETMRHCVESCPPAPAAPADAPKDAPAETPPAETPKDN
jgi:hypothetical protein